MNLCVVSVVLGALAVTPTALIALGLRWGWLAGIASQVPWTVYDLVTGQPGFLIITAVSLPVLTCGWVRARRNPAGPVITAGDVRYDTWCRACQAQTRIAIPLHLGKRTVATAPVTVLEICATCGNGFAPRHPIVTTTVAARPPPQLNPLVAVLWLVHRHVQARHGRPARACAYRNCRRPGWWECAHPAG